jgi:hypothetical protein
MEKFNAPDVSITDPQFRWTRGSDVQKTWRKYGWTPPSEKMEPPPPEKVIQPEQQPNWLRHLHRAK